MLKQLSDLDFGETGVVTDIRASSHELNCMGLRCGKKLVMITRQPIKGPVVVTVDDVEIAMGIEMAAQVIVQTA